MNKWETFRSIFWILSLLVADRGVKDMQDYDHYVFFAKLVLFKILSKTLNVNSTFVNTRKCSINFLNKIQNLHFDQYSIKPVTSGVPIFSCKRPNVFNFLNLAKKIFLTISSPKQFGLYFCLYPDELFSITKSL